MLKNRPQNNLFLEKASVLLCIVLQWDISLLCHYAHLKATVPRLIWNTKVCLTLKGDMNRKPVTHIMNDPYHESRPSIEK